MSGDKAEVGDLVRDEGDSYESVVTDLRGGRYILRPRYCGGINSERTAKRVQVLARRGTCESL